MKIALVHDDFIQLGGAESLFGQMAKIFPRAPIYTSLANSGGLPETVDPKRIKASFLIKIPFASKFYKILLPFYPIAFESFDFSQYDVVISSTTRFAKSIVTKPATAHICYINSTPRFLDSQTARNYLPGILIFLLNPMLLWLKRWDTAASTRPDFYIANSQNVKDKVKKLYGRSSRVTYPFADTEFFKPTAQVKYQPAEIPTYRNTNPQKYYLVVSRLVKWKKIELALKAASQLGLNLKVVGVGPDQARLSALATKNIEFLGFVGKEKLRFLYRNAKALIVTQEEDFGISTVEAQACSTPVIGFKKGGTSEIIVHKQTGFLFDKQSVPSLKDAILTSSRLKYNKSVIRQNALRFTKKVFEKSLREAVENYVKSA